MPDYGFTATPDAFARFVDAWERGDLPRSEWSHAAHVAIGACYTVRFGNDALERLREAIRRYNTAVGVANTDTSGYHETLTRFWATTIAAAVSGCADEWQAARRAVERFAADRDRHAHYYTFDVVRSVRARREWIAPDRQPLA